MYLTEKQYREMLAQLVRIPEMYIYQLKPLHKMSLKALQVVTMRHEFGAELKNFLLELVLFSTLVQLTCNKDDIALRLC